MKRYIGIFPLFLSLALMIGCASNNQMANSDTTKASAASAQSETVLRRDNQMTVDAANAAAMQRGTRP
jgi:uncharacterized protein YcfL